MTELLSEECYLTHNKSVTGMTNARQRLEPGRFHRGLSDKEIAERLDLEIGQVIEIRCIAENERIPITSYLEAEKTKEERFSKAAGGKGPVYDPKN